jgi:hypothetical protein
MPERSRAEGVLAPERLELHQEFYNLEVSDEAIDTAERKS